MRLLDGWNIRKIDCSSVNYYMISWSKRNVSSINQSRWFGCIKRNWWLCCYVNGIQCERQSSRRNVNNTLPSTNSISKSKLIKISSVRHNKKSWAGECVSIDSYSCTRKIISYYLCSSCCQVLHTCSDFISSSSFWSSSNYIRSIVWWIWKVWLFKS